MSYKRISTALGAIALAASMGAVAAHVAPAKAADISDYDASLKDTVVYAPAPIWTGFYVGIHGGYADGEWDGDLKTRKPSGKDEDAKRYLGWEDWRLVDPSEATIDADGWLAGGQIGYNWQHNDFVFGVEGDISWTDSDGRRSFRENGGENTNHPWTSGKSLNADIDYFGTARVRLGYAVDSFMPYLTGGFAWGRTEIDYTTTWEQNGPSYVSGKAQAEETHSGWTIGGGVESIIFDNLSVKVEYLYVDLGEEEYVFKGKHLDSDGKVIYTNWAQDGNDTDLDFHTFRIGVNYLFGRRDEPVDTYK